MSDPPALDFDHIYQPPAVASSNTLLLLHGTGGNERDLLPLGPMIAPGDGILSPRGKVLERGMPRFFRRLAEGLFDEEDLKRRAGELADFVTEAARHYGFDPSQITAVGFSNGANIASAVMLLRPGVLARGILIRAMVPLLPDPLPRIGTRVLISNGRADPTVSVEETNRLSSLLRSAGGTVDVAWQPGGHQLTQGDIVAARDWLQSSTIMGG